MEICFEVGKYNLLGGEGGGYQGKPEREGGWFFVPKRSEF